MSSINIDDGYTVTSECPKCGNPVKSSIDWFNYCMGRVVCDRCHGISEGNIDQLMKTAEIWRGEK